MDEQKSAQSPPRCKCRVSVLLGSLAAIAVGICFLVSYRPDVVTASQSAAQSFYQSTFVAATGPTQQHVDDAAGASLQSTNSAVRSGAAKPKLAASGRSPLTGANEPSTAAVPAIVRQRFDRLYHTSPLSVQFWNTGNMVLEHEDAYPEAKVFRGDLLETVVTPFQVIEIYLSPTQGHILFLNQSMQLTQLEAPHYHEMIVHTALSYLPQATAALVVGGGDGHTLAELLKHKNLQTLMQVEIDQQVMDVCAKYFPGIKATYADPRATVIVKDVRLFLKEQMAAPKPEQFDLIVIDSTDIDLSIGLAATLGSYKKMLKPNGILIAEVDTGGPQKVEGFAEDFEIFRAKFEHTLFFVAHGTAWVSGSIVFAFCSDSIHPMRAPIDWAAFRAKAMPLHFYNPAVHFAAFALPSLYLRATKQTLEDVTPSWFVLDHGEQLKQQAEAAAETAERARAAERRAKAEREEKLANSDGAEGPPTQPRRKLRLAKK